MNYKKHKMLPLWQHPILNCFLYTPSTICVPWVLKYNPSVIRYSPILSFITLSSSSKFSFSLKARMLCSGVACTKLPYLISNVQNSIFSFNSFSSIFNLSILSILSPVLSAKYGVHILSFTPSRHIYLFRPLVYFAYMLLYIFIGNYSILQ